MVLEFSVEGQSPAAGWSLRRFGGQYLIRDIISGLLFLKINTVLVMMVI
jgi:hypothetical protein